MYNLILSFVLFLTPFTLPAQNLAGTWTTQTNNSTETITFTNNGYLVGAWGEDFFREEFYGAYDLSGGRLTVQLFNQERKRFDRIIRNASASGFQMVDPQSGEVSSYSKAGAARLDGNAAHMLRSWENYYKLQGRWESPEETLTFLDRDFLIFTPTGSTPNFGIYKVNGNSLEVYGLENPDQMIYQGNIRQLTANSLQLTANGQATNYRFLGQPQLNETELFFYKEFLRINHQVSMNAIDGIDGVRDFIWKRVER